MNGRERLLKTLKGERADRVPISPFLYYNNVYEMFGYKPDIESFFDPPDFDPIEKFVEYCDYFGFDVLHTLGSVWDFYTAYNSTNDRAFARAWDNWDVTIHDVRQGDDKHRNVTVRTPEGEITFAEEYRRSSPHLCVSAPMEYPIKTAKDFELVREYAPPADTMDCRLVTRAKETVGDKGLITPCTGGVFNQVAQFRSLEALLTDPLTDEGLYREMMEWALERVIQRDRKLVAAGAEVLEVAGNLATSAVGPKFYTRFVLEYEQRLMDAIHEMGALIIFHNCGDAAKIMHLYNDMGIDCWGYLTPKPFGDVDLDEALRVIRPEIALRGNIDQVEFMVKATPQEVKERVRDLLAKVKPRGNWILSTTDFFFDGTPYENIMAFADAGREYGAYD
jgi:uroporphyrinogen-III decarboxylase